MNSTELPAVAGPVERGVGPGSGAQMLDREALAVAGIPASIAARLRLAQEKFSANGGCPGCNSMVLGAHESGCEVCADDLY